MWYSNIVSAQAVEPQHWTENLPLILIPNLEEFVLSGHIREAK